jgi:hypothetical protein
MIYANGDEYDGEWLHDKIRKYSSFIKPQLDGKGIFKYSMSDDTYEGEWLMGKRHGKGRCDFG